MQPVKYYRAVIMRCSYYKDVIELNSEDHDVYLMNKSCCSTECRALSLSSFLCMCLCKCIFKKWYL